MNNSMKAYKDKLLKLLNHEGKDGLNTVQHIYTV